MKKRKSVIVFIIIFLALIPLWSYLWWRSQDDKIIRAIIVDKTVSTLERQEHRSFNWILNHYRFMKPNKEFYSINDDYYGFFPLKPIEKKKFEIHDFENFSDDEVLKLGDNSDMAYYTDTYGVYRNEWYLDTLETEHSPKIYGGMTAKEVLLLKKLKEQKKLIITEFNTIGSPTSKGVRNDFETTFDVKWSGWNCRYFELLDTIRNKELPRWVIKLYKAQHNNKWPFKNSGLVYVHESSRLFILENKTHLIIETPFIHTIYKYRKEYRLPDSIHYPYWLDITFSGNTNTIISYIKIYPNDKGDSILKMYDLPSKYPAVIEHKEPYTFYYFAGDFADNPIRNSGCYFKGIHYLDYFLYNEHFNDRTKFFWRFYYPLVSKIMLDYYKRMEK